MGNPISHLVRRLETGRAEFDRLRRVRLQAGLDARVVAQLQEGDVVPLVNAFGFY